MDRLLKGVELLDTRGDLSSAEVSSIALDSRRVEPGAMFCCVPGRQFDGHDFAAAAVSAGAIGLVAERVLPVDVPQAVVAQRAVRPVMAQVACTLYGRPADALLSVGVTGTNGKTTVTHLLAAVFEEHGMPCTVVGTLDGPRTTPEAPDLQRLLAEARDGGKRALSMEVSSHALTESRVDGIRFAAAVFTNLSPEHLDHHGTMEAYFSAKASLFSSERADLGVVNADDDWGRRLLEEAEIPMVGFSVSDASEISSTRHGTAFTWRGHRVNLQLAGAFQAGNAVAAATAAAALGVPEETVAAGLARATPVPGRFEVVGSDAPFTMVVDYAHTPDGLRTALAGARQLADGGRVLCVFGCGGDRDRAKRPVMGAVAAASADLVVVTSDNPRSENPAAIIDEIMSGVPSRRSGPGPEPASVMVEPDRGRAIFLAVSAARPGDVVLVAGKGHEQTIEMAGQQLPFDDRVEAAAALSALAGRRGS
jgi:UDP-N-acetylmuramoyl-L-alanyl-D-glutamate--2,6-diaminopimelate ligase